MSNYDILEELVIDWADERGIFEQSTASDQLRKTQEELDELKDAVARGHLPDTVDAFGDVLVTLIIAAEMLNLDLVDCLESAYNEIKDRKGKMINGVFVKDE